MKIFPRAVALTAGVAALALAMTGCSSSEPAAGPNDKVELRMLVNITPNLTQTWWADLVKPFEAANPNITVKIQAPVTENVLTTVPQLLASGDVPDIIQSTPPTATLAPELLDLSGYDFVKKSPLAEQYTIDGKYYTAGVGQQLLRRSIERLAETHQRRGGRLFQQPLQQSPARLDALAPHIVAIEICHVEQVIHDGAGRFRIERALQGTEVRVTAGIVDDDFTVIPAWRQAHLFQRLPQRLDVLPQRGSRILRIYRRRSQGCHACDRQHSQAHHVLLEPYTVPRVHTG